MFFYSVVTSFRVPHNLKQINAVVEASKICIKRLISLKLLIRVSNTFQKSHLEYCETKDLLLRTRQQSKGVSKTDSYTLVNRETLFRRLQEIFKHGKVIFIILNAFCYKCLLHRLTFFIKVDLSKFLLTKLILWEN